ncbi:MAG: hypothetical protein K0U98_11025 [Deltaproteobacteria bacterium]|nr:hypothetical protein [Deltaproteobacteria bacterium]
MRFLALASLVALFQMLSSSSLQAEIVEVTVLGEVEFNQVTTPPLGNVNPGDAAQLTFLVDSESFVDSGSFPTRGYDIDLSSFALSLGTETLGLQDPFPVGQVPFLVLRDNDPVVDGFFISTNIDVPMVVPIDQAGALGQFANSFSVTYEGSTLVSLNLLDALGSYDFTGLTVFNWTVDDGPFQPLGIVFTELAIALGGVFEDGFESGDTSAWSLAFP